jgi:EAL domain-containing protein (putative c-di-GMP-specific phosphodiesterase class I)
MWFAEAWEVGRGAELELAAARTALATLRTLPARIAMSINASPGTIEDPGLLEAVDGVGARVIVEVTEHAEIEDAERFGAAMARLRDLGVRLAIDDVGTGYSSLSKLLDLGPEIFKLDISLTRDIDTDPKRGAMTTSLVAFGADAGLELIAEGIETGAELDALVGRGVRYGQGYFLARPAPDPVKVISEPLSL